MGSVACFNTCFALPARSRSLGMSAESQSTRPLRIVKAVTSEGENSERLRELQGNGLQGAAC